MTDPATYPVPVLMVGAGARAHVYAEYARENPGRMRLSGVVDPDRAAALELASRYGLGESAVHVSTESAVSAQLESGEPTHAAIDTTPDKAHVDTAEVLLDGGYDLLLEKPVGTTTAELQRLAAAVGRNPRAVTRVCHVLRHAPFYRRLREIVSSGQLGALLSVVHTENVAYWHFAHSFVRGNWRNQQMSSPFILAKTCHDIDLLSWMLEEPFVATVSSTGRQWFQPANAPEGAAQRCGPDCSVADTCAYNAERWYGVEGDFFPAQALVRGGTAEARLEALRTSPYGRCVYACDNDAPDDQTALFRTASGHTAVLHISGHAAEETRVTRIDGSRGSILARFRGSGGSSTIAFHSVEDWRQTDELGAPEDGQGHGGGDLRMVGEFVDAVVSRATGRGATIESALPSHYAALAADRSLTENRWVTVAPSGA